MFEDKEYNYNLLKEQMLQTNSVRYSPFQAAYEKKHRRQRTSYTPEQLRELEKSFQESHFVDRNKKLELASKFALSENHIKVWFKNRRAKSKKEKHVSGSSYSDSTSDAGSVENSLEEEPQGTKGIKSNGGIINHGEIFQPKHNISPEYNQHFYHPTPPPPVKEEIKFPMLSNEPNYEVPFINWPTPPPNMFSPYNWNQESFWPYMQRNVQDFPHFSQMYPQSTYPVESAPKQSDSLINL
ncbi:unnamed protein product [Brassicogethes aeneus]|uniref:Homeobox domain-containing protein n=1 Tax=Brassicogethes aeneus TaxID=1431903 RepID=A0A9P0FIZ9_BRAAE|nr:unnamed protein product [Brassicogethes aeneus]